LVIYLDSSAIVKLITKEDETAALVDWLNERPTQPLVASALVEIEVPRALRRSDPRVLGAVAAVLARINRMDMDASVRATAAAYTDPHVRSLDAIHLATADVLVASGKTVTSFVTYDKRLAAVAGEAGLPVSAPGTT
jgi:hypothetical protein